LGRQRPVDELPLPVCPPSGERFQPRRELRLPERRSHGIASHPDDPPLRRFYRDECVVRHRVEVHLPEVPNRPRRPRVLQEHLEGRRILKPPLKPVVPPDGVPILHPPEKEFLLLHPPGGLGVAPGRERREQAKKDDQQQNEEKREAARAPRGPRVTNPQRGLRPSRSPGRRCGRRRSPPPTPRGEGRRPTSVRCS